MNINASEMWDTHVHCFDPDRYPFKPTRTYTPRPALLESLLQNSQTGRLVLVQASIETGHQALIAHLQRIHNEHPHFVARGSICIDENWERVTNEEFDDLHNLGVRSCRLQGFNGAGGTSLSIARKQIRRFACSYPASKHGWSLSAQLPLEMWSSLKQYILHEPELSSITLIADHNGCATPADIGSAGLDAFGKMLRSGRLYVKISALYRRSPESIHHMQPIIQQFATTAPHALLWGSDWPHVDSSSGSLHPPTITENGTPRNNDTLAEISALRSWLTDEQWSAMLIDNPNRLFGH